MAMTKKEQAEMESLRRERNNAVRALKEWTDDQTESPFRVDDSVSDGESQGPSFRTRYIQTYKINCTYAGVELRLMLRGDKIEIGWSAGGDIFSDVVMRPSGHQQIEIYIPNGDRGVARGD